MVSILKDGARWKVRPDFLPLLDAVLAAPCSFIKDSPAKQVAAHEWEGKRYFVKRYRPGWRTFLPMLFWFRRSPAAAEWALSLELEKRGTATVRHLAYGDRWSRRGLLESILITEGFDGVRLTALPAPDWDKVLAFVSRMHDQGVIQPDLHVGNLLCSPSSGELRLVDLGHARIKRGVSDRERKRNLAFLRISVPLPVPPEVEELSVRMGRDYFRARSRRCLKNNREFAPRKAAGVRWQVRLPFLSNDIRLILDDPDGFLRTRAEVLKSGRTTRVGCSRGLVVKRYNFRKSLSSLKDLFRTSRARKGFVKGYHLELLGISTPRVLAMGERRIGPILLSSYLVTEKIQVAHPLQPESLDEYPSKAAIVKGLAALVAGLHDAGFSHRDLKAGNILIDANGKPYLLDLDGLKYRGTVSSARAAADLDRLARATRGWRNVGPAERFVFLRHYCKMRKLHRVPRA